MTSEAYSILPSFSQARRYMLLNAFSCYFLPSSADIELFPAWHVINIRLFFLIGTLPPWTIKVSLIPLLMS